MCTQAHPGRVGRKDQAGCGHCPPNLHGNQGSHQLGQPKQPWRVSRGVRGCSRWQPQPGPCWAGREPFPRSVGQRGPWWGAGGDQGSCRFSSVQRVFCTPQRKHCHNKFHSVVILVYGRDSFEHIHKTNVSSVLTVLNSKSPNCNTGTSGLQQKIKQNQITEFREFWDQRWGYRTDWLGWSNNKTYDPAILTSLATWVPKSELEIYKYHKTTQNLIQKYFNDAWSEIPFSENNKYKWHYYSVNVLPQTLWNLNAEF